MRNIVSEFVSFMASHGLAPANTNDIQPDNKRHDYQLATDKPGKKKGFYKLKIEGDFGFGFFGDYRQGEAIAWHAKTDKKITDKERREYAKRAAEERIKAEQEQLAIWKAKAAEAREHILFLSDCPDNHPYLVKKGIRSHGLLLSGDQAIMPIGNTEGVWSYQAISPDGSKKFPYQSRKSGLYFKINGSGRVALCEGYATAASIHEATGCTAYAALDAGNLVIVAPEIRKLHPDAEIIICADNDAFTKKPDGTPTNPGLIKGKQAAIEINALFTYPEFNDNVNKFTDFNDLHQSEGLQAVIDRIGQAQKPDLDSEAPAVLAPSPAAKSRHGGGDVTLDIDESWREKLHVNKNGDPLPGSPTNLHLFMQYHEPLRGVFRYDSFSKRIIVPRCPPWESADDFKVRPISDYDYFRLECFLETECGLKVQKTKCADAIESTAQLPENIFNPAADYFNALEWDGVSRVDTWLQRHVSDGKQPNDYLTLVGRKFLCGLAGRAMRPGVKFDTMIILEGKQYAGKSYLSRVLATINGEEYFLDDFKDIDNKDALMKMQGKLVIEFAEISTMRKAEVNDLKAFLSRTHDVFRPPYGRNTLEAPRQCVFVGTINPEGPYLRDVTGNRRYWPVSCRDDIDIKELKKIMPQLHAEAAHYVKLGEQLWITKDEYQLAAAEQDKRVVNDVWIDTIQDILLGKNEITTDEILQALDIPKERRTPQAQSRIVQTMTSLGWQYARLVRGTKRPRGFIKTEFKTKDNHELFDESEEIAW